MPVPRALLFDMDGTLTRPLLDFPGIRGEMGVPDGHGILEWLSTLPPGRRGAAEEILHRHENRAAEHSDLNAGCNELLACVEARRLRVAVITRNSRRCAETVMRKHNLRVDFLITREDAVFKPDPAPLRLACRQLEVHCPDAWMIGDGEFDVQAGLAAGCPTVWLSHGKTRPFADVPWRTVPDLIELQNLLQRTVS